MKYMLENPIDNIIFETFSVEMEVFGEPTVIDLKDNGRNIDVTDDNKEEYVKLWTEWRLKKGTEEQFEALQTGFLEVVDKELLKMFDAHELQMLISGIPDLDVDDWRKNTVYRGEFNDSHPVIQVCWFSLWVLFLDVLEGCF